MEKGKRKNRQNPKRVVVILLILPEHVYISGRVCGGCSSGVVPRGLRGAVREARYSPSRGPDDDRPRQPQDHQRHVCHDWGDIYLRQTAHSLRQNSPGGTVVAPPAAEPVAIDEKAAEVIAEVERQKAEREEAGS